MSWHIHIKGQVQGVGFRPFVFLTAIRFKLNGWVNNTDDGVHIVISADEKQVLDFLGEIKRNAPAISRITSVKIFQIQNIEFADFQIIHSKSTGNPNLLITPDLATCSECKAELRENENRRKNYSFTTCTNCGPRYSITKNLPYDRDQTTMDSFEMCDSCLLEYENPENRRYFSQTNSCPSCGVMMSLFDSNNSEIILTQNEILDYVVESWKSGKILAIKGIGGYILTCDASNSDAVKELRKRKYRPTKPFAVMHKSEDSFDKFRKSNAALEQLRSEASPIVILERVETSSIADEVAPGLSSLGVMVPYTPMYEILLRRFDGTIVATSANVSNSPIIYDDEKAHESLSAIADFILTNNRKITIPQDDSVLKFTYWKNRKIIIRRSRGLAPTYINTDLNLSKSTVLAMGAMMKSTFTLLNKENTYISQYLGDLENYDTLQTYQSMIEYFLSMLNVRPQIILCDKHEAYHSTEHGEILSNNYSVPLRSIQHHRAHLGAILGEHNLIDSREPILGVIWDGTGLGDDGNIWGGEFFRFENYAFTRSCNFEYFDFILGDKMAKEPRISALSACWDVMGAEEYLREKFSDTEWNIYSNLLKKDTHLKTSSVGRIFDAVASILGIMDTQTYEGEAAIRLESIATTYFKEHGLEFTSSYFIEGAHYYRIPTKALMINIILDMAKGKSKEYMAAKFHYSMALLVKIVANNLNIRKIAFSGGVFQNGLLVDLIEHHVGVDFDLYFHERLSPNDENISFGQLVCYQIEQHNESFINQKNEQVCV